MTAPIKKTATVVINLPDRTDRRSEMEAQLESVNWKAEFFPAIRPQDAANFPSIGARGCFLSHLEVLREAKRRELDRLVIIEDDLNFVSTFEAGWKKIDHFLQTETWSIFYPAHTLSSDRKGIIALKPEISFTCAHMIVFNGQDISKAVFRLEEILTRPAGDPRGGPMHVDGAYSTIRRQNPDLKTFAFFPSIGYQRSSRSDIADDRWFDKATILKPVVRTARLLKRRLRYSSQSGLISPKNH